MNIALIGYGKMGKAIEKIAIEKGHQITAIVDSKNPIELLKINNIDVAIEFTRPELARKHMVYCLVGWYKKSLCLIHCFELNDYSFRLGHSMQ